MLEFFIMFLIVGALIGFILDEKTAITSIVIISILWLFIYGPWAVATFFELLLGYGLAKKLSSK